MAFVAAQPGDALFTTDVTFAELRFGIEQLADSGRRADLRLWLDRTLRPLFAGRVLGITEEVMLRWKTMAVAGQKRGHTFSQPDLFIAAIAALEGLVVVTRDTKEFVANEVPTFDPFAGVAVVAGRSIVVPPPANLATLTAAARRGDEPTACRPGPIGRKPPESGRFR